MLEHPSHKMRQGAQSRFCVRRASGAVYGTLAYGFRARDKQARLLSRSEPRHVLFPFLPSTPSKRGVAPALCRYVAALRSARFCRDATRKAPCPGACRARGDERARQTRQSPRCLHAESRDGARARRLTPGGAQPAGSQADSSRDRGAASRTPPCAFGPRGGANAAVAACLCRLNPASAHGAAAG